MKPIYEQACFLRFARGPVLHRVLWSETVLIGFEFVNQDGGGLGHLRLKQVEAVLHASEEVHAGRVFGVDTNAAIHDLGQTDWLRSFHPDHLSGCSHFQIQFYDDIYDVICQGIEFGEGPLVEQSAQSNLIEDESGIADSLGVLFVQRSRQWFGRFRSLEVLVDGVVHTRIRSGEFAELFVAAGEHTVQTRMDWCYSRELRVSCASGVATVVRCESAPFLYAGFYSLFAPRRVLHIWEKFDHRVGERLDYPA